MTPNGNSSLGQGQWLGIYVKRQDIVGDEVWVVTISNIGHDARTRLFADRAAAYEFALERSEWLDLPLFDNADAGAAA